MADIPASTWSETDADNNTAAPLGFPEGMAPSGVNNGARAVMGAVKRWFNWTIPKTTGGTTTAYTLSYGVAPAALVDGMSHLVQFNAACGASPTLNINSLGAKPLYYYTGSAWAQVTAAGTIPANFIGRVSYNSSEGSYRITSGSFSIGAALLAVANTFTGANTFSAALTMSGAPINTAKGADIASTATINLTTATGNVVDLTGTTTVTAITLAEGAERTVRTTGALTFAHGSSLVLPTASNITTAAGDFWTFRGYAGGVVRLQSYTLASGLPLVGPANFLANKNGVDQTLSDETWTKLTFGTESFDVGGYYDTTNSRWTPPAGKYVINGRWGTSAFGAANVGSIGIYVNGSRVYSNTIADANGLRDFTVAITQIMSLSGTDYVELWGYVNTAGTSQDIDGAAEFTTFSGSRLL